MDETKWSLRIKKFLLAREKGKDGRLNIGISFAGGLENGMFVHCRDVQKVPYYISSSNRPSIWNLGSWISLIKSYRGHPKPVAEMGIINGKYCFYNEGPIMDGDIVIQINDMPAIGLPLAYVNDILLPEDFPSDVIMFELLSTQHSPVSTTSGNPTELADYLKLDYSGPDCKRERDAQGGIRHYAYCMLPAFTTRPEHEQPPYIATFPVDYLYISEDHFAQRKAENDVLEYGVLNGHVYGTLLPKRTEDMEYSAICYEMFTMSFTIKRTQSFYDALHLNPRFTTDFPYTPYYPTRKTD